jgi:hypothetical protein
MRALVPETMNAEIRPADGFDRLEQSTARYDDALAGAVEFVGRLRLYGTTTDFPSHTVRKRSCSGVGFGSTSNLTGIPDASSVSVIPNLA